MDNRNEKLSTAKITTFLHENNKDNDQKATSSNDLQEQEKLVLTKSYRPAKLPTKAEIEAEYSESYREAVRTGEIRTDGHNLRLDEESQMYFYLPKNHPEYTAYHTSDIRNDKKNIRYDKKRDMHFYLHKDDPEYEEENDNYICKISKSCTII